MVGDNIETGVYSKQKALQMASNLDLDLVEISGKAVKISPIFRKYF